MGQTKLANFLEDPAVRAFIARSHRRRLPAKQTVLHAGDTADSVYLILEGSVRILVEDAEGREMVLAYRHPGEFFGEMCLFPELDTRSARVQTRSETWVSEMDLQSFRQFVEDNPHIMFVLAGQLAVSLRDTSRRLADLNFLDVTGRIARILLELGGKPDAEPADQGKVVKISRQELAQIAACSREMAGRVLKSLEDDGLIESNGRRILVFDPAG